MFTFTTDTGNEIKVETKLIDVSDIYDSNGADTGRDLYQYIVIVRGLGKVPYLYKILEKEITEDDVIDIIKQWYRQAYNKEIKISKN